MTLQVHSAAAVLQPRWAGSGQSLNFSSAEHKEVPSIDASFLLFCQVYNTPSSVGKGTHNRDLAHAQEIYDVPPSVEKGLQVVSWELGVLDEKALGQKLTAIRGREAALGWGLARWVRCRW